MEWCSTTQWDYCAVVCSGGALYSGTTVLWCGVVEHYTVGLLCCGVEWWSTIQWDYCAVVWSGGALYSGNTVLWYGVVEHYTVGILC